MNLDKEMIDISRIDEIITELKMKDDEYSSLAAELLKFFKKERDINNFDTIGYWSDYPVFPLKHDICNAYISCMPISSSIPLYTFKEYL